LSSTQRTPKTEELWGEVLLRPQNPAYQCLPFHPRAEPNINTAGKGQQTGVWPLGYGMGGLGKKANAKSSEKIREIV